MPNFLKLKGAAPHAQPQPQDGSEVKRWMKPWLIQRLFGDESESVLTSESEVSDVSTPRTINSRTKKYNHRKECDDKKLNRSFSGSGSTCVYGWIEKECVGEGTNGIVRIAHLPCAGSCEKLYAIKEFRRRSKSESDKSFKKKMISEFCIGSALHHENVIETVDLIQNDDLQWCEVLEYCSGTTFIFINLIY
jgi:protein-serine/threonine kinase